MSGCCSGCGFKSCKCDCGFTNLSGPAIESTLIASLTCVADQIRNIGVCLGARPYKVSLIWTRWTYGERGFGAEEVIRVEPILPVPLVRDLNSLRSALQNIGVIEDGSVRISEISPRFTEDFLNGLGPNGEPIPQDVNFFWEVNYERPNNSGVRRRFTPISAPYYDPTNFEWRVDLQKAAENRARNGDV